MPRPETNKENIRKLSKVGGKTFAVTIPIKEIRKLKWRLGDKLTVTRKNNYLIIEKIEKD